MLHLEEKLHEVYVFVSGYVSAKRCQVGVLLKEKALIQRKAHHVLVKLALGYFAGFVIEGCFYEVFEFRFCERICEFVKKLLSFLVELFCIDFLLDFNCCQ